MMDSDDPGYRITTALEIGYRRVIGTTTVYHLEITIGSASSSVMMPPLVLVQATVVPMQHIVPTKLAEMIPLCSDDAIEGHIEVDFVCPHCGKPSGGQKFCGKCGTLLLDRE